MDDSASIAVVANNSHSSSNDQEESGLSVRRRAECVTRRYYIAFSTIMLVVTATVILVCASPQQGDLRLSGHPSGQGASGRARTRDRRVPADLRADSLATVPPTPFLLLQNIAK
ncbi:hypothetical protein PoB_003016600 [Plakobranchus ocellatus]|uniref:Uncharacterized protein n=1 Tax=Plakobranchus ocellatus TaxID=259542 RepID=A0AAV4AAK5_9GAST|nr:hypothetical protein PoB_003016600 [Plakobranchus ocellatus]